MMEDNPDSQDELLRLLRKTTFDVVKKAMEDKVIGSGKSLGGDDVREILSKYGWNMSEFLDGLINHMRRHDNN
jgi:hypothetical protein